MSDPVKHRLDANLDYPGSLKKMHLSPETASLYSGTSTIVETEKSLENEDNSEKNDKISNSFYIQDSLSFGEETPKKSVKQEPAGQDLINVYLKDPTGYIDNYKVLKYKEIKYYINSNMLIRNHADSTNDFICKLLRIIRPAKLENQRVLAFLQVQWYYKKSDLGKKYQPYIKAIGDNEVFLSSHKDLIMVDCINGPCEILSYDEYDKLDPIPVNTFFTRAEYDVIKKKMIPPIENWTKHCTCKLPLNPDFTYIQCDKCDIWFHLDCVGISQEGATVLNEYICDQCRKRSSLYSKPQIFSP